MKIAEFESWNERWREGPALSVPLPWPSWVEILISGVAARTIEVRFDGEELPQSPAASGGVVANAAATAGSHRVAVRWKGPSQGDPPTVQITARQSKTIADIEAENPALALLMKQADPRFVPCRVLSLTFPEGTNVTVYGLYFVDTKELAKNDERRPVFKQDFVVYEPGTHPRRVTYYSGRPGPKLDKAGVQTKPVGELCARFGSAYFGCEQDDRGRWHCEDHWLSLADLQSRLLEPTLRNALEAALALARQMAQGQPLAQGASPRPRPTPSSALPKRWMVLSVPASDRTAKITHHIADGKVRPRRTYTHSLYLKVDVATGSPLVVQRLTFLDAAGVSIGEVSEIRDSGETSWTRKAATVVAPPWTRSARIDVIANPELSAVGTAFVGHLQLEEGETATPWRNAPQDDAPIRWSSGGG